MSVRSSDVVIAGAGIIGLSAALELAAHGLSVTVLEHGAAMREASWAAAGMLASHDPENPSELRELADLSVALYPDFLATIERLSGLHVPLRTSGTLQGSHANQPMPGGLALDRLHTHVPELTSGHRAFRWLNEQSLDPRDLCRALPLAARCAGVLLHEQVRFKGVERQGGKLRIRSSQGEFFSQHFVHCCGAWSAMPGFALPVEPVKGQMLTITLPAGAPVLSCVLRTPEVYLVPRDVASAGGAAQPSRVIIGATIERVGFDRSIDEAATDSLLAAAAELWPPIRNGIVSDRWAGLRPGAPDSLPIIGSLADFLPTAGGEVPNSWVATGHLRNGILLAPGTARVLSELVQGRALSIDLRAFRPGRFAAVQAVS